MYICIYIHTYIHTYTNINILYCSKSEIAVVVLILGVRMQGRIGRVLSFSIFACKISLHAKDREAQEIWRGKVSDSTILRFFFKAWGGGTT